MGWRGLCHKSPSAESPRVQGAVLRAGHASVGMLCCPSLPWEQPSGFGGQDRAIAIERRNNSEYILTSPDLLKTSERPRTREERSNSRKKPSESNPTSDDRWLRSWRNDEPHVQPIPDHSTVDMVHRLLRHPPCMSATCGLIHCCGVIRRFDIDSGKALRVGTACEIAFADSPWMLRSPLC